MKDRKHAWADLKDAAIKFSKDPSTAMAQYLATSAEGWAQAKGFRPPPSGGHDVTGGSKIIKFGRAKGTPISDAETDDLEWVASCLRVSIDDPDKARWKKQNSADLAAIEAELEER